MRVFLTVVRNGLPATEVVWSLPDSDTANDQFTIAKFLAQVNESIPLESEEWGLEDYVVEVGGYECIHYHSARRLLSEDDNVVIRPLETSDVRSRHIGGRSQISAGGMHLLDGIPFGRERGPGRPSIQIPSRKRTRDLPEALNDPQDFLQLPEEYLQQDFQEFEQITGKTLLLTNGPSDDADLSQPLKKRQRTSDSHVRFDEFAMQTLDDDDDEEDDEDYEEEVVDDRDVNADEDEDEDDEDDENDSEDEEDKGSEEDEEDEEDEEESSSDDSSEDDSDSDESGESESDDSTDSDSSISDSDDDESEEDSDSDDELKKSLGNESPNLTKKPTVNGVKQEITQNKAAKAQKNLQLEMSDSVTNSVAFSDESTPVPPGSGKVETKNRNQRRKIAKKIKELIETGKLPPNATHEDLKKYEAVIENDSDATAAIEASRKRSFDDKNTDQSVALEDTPDIVSTPKRPKFDMGPATRMIYGSLGVRTPKSEKEALQVAETLRQRNSKVSVITPQELINDVPPESDAWRSKISLSAIDCNTDQWLKPAPYPCPPDWRSYPIEENEIDVLDYDEPDEDKEVEEGPNQFDWELEHKLPVTEKEFEALPDAQARDYRSDAIIAFQIMEMSAATNFQPNITKYRTAIIVNTIDSDSVEVEYSMKDNFAKRSSRNATTKRINQLMNTMEEEEDSPTVVWIPNMINPKLIAPGALNESPDLDDKGIKHEEARTEVSQDHEGTTSSEEEEESDGERNTSSDEEEVDSEEERNTSSEEDKSEDEISSNEDVELPTDKDQSDDDEQAEAIQVDEETELPPSEGGSLFARLFNIRNTVNGAFQRVNTH